MMKKFFTPFLTLISCLGVIGQNPGLVAGNSDVIGLTGFPASPLLIQSGPANFYWLGGSYQGTSVDHPMLSNKVFSDFSNIYFIRYDNLGNPLASAVISGTSNIPYAFSPDGGLTVVGNATANVEANGNILPLNGASQLEFIAKFNDLCQFERMVSIWNLEPSQYPSSRAMMDPVTGDLYLTGVSYQPFNLMGYGIIGKDLADYLYVLKYDRNLALTGVFTAGFDEVDTEYGYYSNLRITPGGKGSVMITGIWQGDRTPVIGGDTLTSTMMNSQGVFAFKLDGAFRIEWVLEGTLQGFDYDGFSGISEGMALPEGDLVMVGATSTGHFSLGEAKLDYDSGAGFSNMFAFRISPGGAVRWVRPLENRDEAYDINKKGAESEEFSPSMEWDAIQWKNEVLYLTGKFSGNQFKVAGRTLENSLGIGAFVVALDLNTGGEKWGYSLSSSWVELNGFDLDGSGNVTLMGKTASTQVFEGFDSVTVNGTDPVFHLGIDHLGKPLWYNNARFENFAYSPYGCDLEVLPNGEVFSTLYKFVSDPLLIGGSALNSKDLYSTLLVALSADNALGGKVSDQSGNPVYPGVVKAFKVTNTGAYPVVQTVDIDDSGVYLFNGLYPGNYAFLAIPDLEYYPDGMPTYAGGGVTWGNGQIFDVAPDTRATFLNITLSRLPRLTAADGNGHMLGLVFYADDFIAKSTMARPVTGTAVILKKKAASKGTLEDDLVAYIQTDEFGEYRFDYVPNGEYNMIVDLPGLQMINNYDVVIVDNMVVGGLDFVVENGGINIPEGVGVEPLEMNLARIYPNPGNGLLHIELRSSGDFRVQVFNTEGRMVQFRNYLSMPGLVDLDLSDLQRGIYLIKIDGEEGCETMKYIRE